MARPRVADGGLRIWQITANVLNKQLWTADKGSSSSLGAGQEAKTPNRNLCLGVLLSCRNTLSCHIIF
jgi:hypothetical protein